MGLPEVLEVEVKGEVRQRQPVVPRRRQQTRAESEAEREAQEKFKQDVLFLDMGKCIGATAFGADHECHGPLQAHHCVRAQILRAHISTLDLREDEINAWIWNPCIGASLCKSLHDRHHDGTGFKVPAEWLPPRVFDFCHNREIKHLLLKEHPPIFDQASDQD